MTDSSKCFPLIRARAFRVTKLDACGNPVPGPYNQVKTTGLITVALTAQTVQGNAITVTDAAGNTVVNDTPPPRFTGWGIAITFAKVNPDLYSILTGNPRVMDAAGLQAIGFQVNESVDLDSNGFALEWWSDVPADQCEVGAAGNWGYGVIPFAKGGILGDFTIANDAIGFQLTGAQSKKGNAWGVGPYDVVLDETDAASPLLVALPSDNHLHLQLTSLAPPVDVCGAVPLGVVATGATAGIPGAYTPSMSYAPADLAGLSGVTASPSTPWTAGQYVTLQDGSTAHWNGTTWVAGPA